jgi:hypothetical protein
MSNEDRRRILQLVADGKISAEEATELLDALPSDRQSDGAREAAEAPYASMPPMPPFPPNRARSLVIQINEGSENKVNLRIPFGLARAAGKFVPRRASQQLKEFGIELEELLNDLSGTEKGIILQVRDEQDMVLIAVE